MKRGDLFVGPATKVRIVTSTEKDVRYKDIKSGRSATVSIKDFESLCSRQSLKPHVPAGKIAQKGEKVGPFGLA